MKLWPLLLGAALAGAQPPEKWFAAPVLPAAARQSQMYAWVNANISPLPRFRTLQEWQAYKAKIKSRILSTLGVDDIQPVSVGSEILKPGRVRRHVE